MSSYCHCRFGSTKCHPVCAAAGRSTDHFLSILFLPEVKIAQVIILAFVQHGTDNASFCAHLIDP